MFINKIIGIIHGTAEYWKGGANKNAGNLYLLSWKIDDNFEDVVLKVFEGLSEQAEKWLEEIKALKEGKLKEKEELKVPEKKKKKKSQMVIEEPPVEEIPLIKTLVVPDQLKDQADSVLIAAIKIYGEIKRAEDLNAYQLH